MRLVPAARTGAFVLWLLTHTIYRIRIVGQALDGLPAGEFTAKVPRVLKIAPGEVYHAIESPKGELGFYLVHDGGPAAYRLRMRTGAFQPGEAELVVGLALLGVGQHLVGLSGFLELLLGSRIARVSVGVVLQRELPIRLLDLVRRGGLGDPEHLVVVLLEPLAPDVAVHGSPLTSARRERWPA